MFKVNVEMNKTVFCGLSVLDMSKIVTYEYLFYYAKPKYGNNAKLLYASTASLIVCVNLEDVYANLEEDFETRFDTSKYDVGRPLPTRKNNKSDQTNEQQTGYNNNKTDFSVDTKDV